MEQVSVLKARFEELSGQLAGRQQELLNLEEQRAAILRQRLEVRGKDREALAAQFGQVDARMLLALAEVEMFHELRVGVFRELRAAELEAAREELETHRREVHRPSKERLEQWVTELRILTNRGQGTELTIQMPGTPLERIVAARVEIARAKGELKIRTVRLRELEWAVELAALAAQESAPELDIECVSAAGGGDSQGALL